ncbi:MAG: 50S ribosomal protein L4 [Candidatus Aminicenantales bacterium]
MSKVQVLDKSGQKIEEISAPPEVLSYPIKEHLLYEAVINWQANRRRGTASTKTRGEVRGGGRKPWRQKGTGRARAGSIRSPLWRKGGRVFGPKPRDYYYNLPKKVKRNALKSALALKYSEKQLLVIKTLEFKEPRTKEGLKFLDKFKLDSALIIDDYHNKNLFLSVRNIPKVKAVDYNQINVYDILNHKWLIFSQNAFVSLMEKLQP